VNTFLSINSQLTCAAGLSEEKNLVKEIGRWHLLWLKVSDSCCKL